jgi:DNA-cytosine methyltransferase
MKYISLFSGIGGFELAIQELYPNAICLGYSEIKQTAISVYNRHFPSHKNIGNITTLTDEDIRKLTADGCDLIVAGFPCSNLSSLSRTSGSNQGLDGAKSGLFYNLLSILKIVKPRFFVIENNHSMGRKNCTQISNLLREELTEKIYCTVLDAKDFGVQSRKRIFWTNFPVETDNVTCTQTWDDVLNDETLCVSDKYISCMNRTLKCDHNPKYLIEVQQVGTKYRYITLPPVPNRRSRWQCSFHSDNSSDTPFTYPVGKSRPVTASFGSHNILCDHRGYEDGEFIPRLFSVTESERLFGFPDGWVSDVLHSRRNCLDCLGNSVVTIVIKYVLSHIIEVADS